MGVVEWLRVRTLYHWAWGLIFPWLAITGGTILLFHPHPVSNFNYLGRNNQPHITEGITAILAGATYLPGEWEIMKQRWWRLVPSALVILMGVQLILYLEYRVSISFTNRAVTNLPICLTWVHVVEIFGEIPRLNVGGSNPLAYSSWVFSCRRVKGIESRLWVAGAAGRVFLNSSSFSERFERKPGRVDRLRSDSITWYLKVSTPNVSALTVGSSKHRWW
jgi:hypothetical protein